MNVTHSVTMIRGLYGENSQLLSKINVLGRNKGHPKVYRLYTNFGIDNLIGYVANTIATTNGECHDAKRKELHSDC